MLVKIMEKKEFVRKIKFVLFSLSAGLIEIGLFTLLENITNWDYWAIYLPSLVASVIWNFTLNREFTFKSANNVTIAMLKVGLFYLIFTPVTTILGNYLAEDLGWNEFIVTLLNMGLNLILEYLYDRYYVFGNSIDTKVNNEEKKRKNKIGVWLVFILLLFTFYRVKAYDEKIITEVSNNTPIKINNGAYAYSIDRSNKIPSGKELYLEGELDKGFSYIIDNGFPNHRICPSDNSLKDCDDGRITQLAIWKYIAISNGRTIANGDEILTYPCQKEINDLVDGAVEARDSYENFQEIILSNETGEFSLSKNSQYFETNSIGISLGVNGTYEVILNNASKKTKVVDMEENEKYVFSPNENFKIVVPVEDYATLNDIKVRIVASNIDFIAYRYSTRDHMYQDIVISSLVQKTKKLETQLSLKSDIKNVVKINIDDVPNVSNIIVRNEVEELYKIHFDKNNYFLINLPEGKYIIEDCDNNEFKNNVFMVDNQEMTVVILKDATNHGTRNIFIILVVIGLISVFYIYGRIIYKKKKLKK